MNGCTSGRKGLRTVDGRTDRRKNGADGMAGEGLKDGAGAAPGGDDILLDRSSRSSFERRAGHRDYFGSRKAKTGGQSEDHVGRA